jgi:hypothetical protein
MKKLLKVKLNKELDSLVEKSKEESEFFVHES